MLVTVALEALRIPAVTVELRDVDRDISIGRTISDAVGEASFPDVPPGRYVIRATREGFADSESSPFTLDVGKTERVLIDMRLTFVRESVNERIHEVLGKERVEHVG